MDAVRWNLADLFEAVVDADPDREVFVDGSGRRLTYAQLDERANRLANHLAGAGIGPGQHVGLQLLNGSEYLEGMLGAFKIRAVPINVNYRYVENELHYLFADADLAALVLHRQFLPKVAAVAGDLDRLRHFVVVEDGTPPGGAELPGATVAYEDALAAAAPDRPDGSARTSDDLYCVYTGGTTGMPKGVLWRHEDIFFGAMGGGDPFQMRNFVTTPAELVERLPAPGLCALPTPPFMHASAHWLAFHQLYCGGKIVVPELGRFDPPTIWQLVGAERVTTLVVVGDAMARPLADELAAHPDRYDTSSLLAIGSGGAILSPSTRAQLDELLPGRIIVDAFGSSETGTVGHAATMKVDDRTTVLDDDLQPVAPGSGTTGRLARTGFIPLGYYNDPEKTAATFVQALGKRWVLPGDNATVAVDGTITLLGRGSVSINTGGEKVYPEEVEAALKAHPAVADAVVVGVPDDRWGERVVAVIATRPGHEVSLPELQEHGRTLLAGYKVPRELVVVDDVVRSPAGKADYQWARRQAIGEP